MFFCKNKNHLEQHAAAPGHRANIRKPQRHRLLTDAMQQLEKDEFNQDLCEAFMAANIPLHKLENPHLLAFLEKNFNRKLASESKFRKSFVPRCYTKVPTYTNIKYIFERIMDYGNRWCSLYA